ncbi:LuxR C-terminal-related transcriptional regulator [Spirillospora sp. CA-294931]|uniref:helix-turn-helix transcriptional regulator n=1 Tax=Spirillospora sp. CA-294931 TaxID=3240042 RepID=UPI003D92B2BC
MTHVIAAGQPEATTLSVAIDVGNEVLARGLEDVLRGLARVAAVRHCRNGMETGLLFRSGGVDVVIMTSAEAAWLREARGGEHDRRAKALVLLDETEVAQAAVPASLPADGFLVQQELTAEALGDALDRMARGEIPMPARLARRLLTHAGTPARAEVPRPVRLTAREQETLNLLAEGLSNKQIARRLSISDHGAKRLVTSVLLKLGAPNRTTAVVTAIGAGMIGHPREAVH